MKHYLISTLVFLSFGCSESEVVNQSFDEANAVPDILVESGMKLISKRDHGVIYFNEDPFSGYLISRYETGSVSIKKGYINGRLDGVTTAYYYDGSIKYIRPYNEGEKHGEHIGFYSNGLKKFQYYFEHGFNEGNHLEWYDNGQKAFDMNYLAGKEFGKQQAWRSDGKLRSNYIVRENGRVYGLQGIKRCTKLDGTTQTIDPYKGIEE